MSAMEDERIAHVEQAVANVQAEAIETRNKLDHIIATMSRLVQHIPDTPAPLPRAATPLPADLPKGRRPKPASPPDFDGERTKGLAFLNSCQTYIRLCPEEFRDEQTKILWAMSYMKTGRASKWTARIFRWEQQPENSTSTRFLDWNDFRDEFKKEFCPAHEDAVALNRLESSAYYQRNRSLDDYLDEFLDLVADSGYTDPKTIVVKFRRGLNSQIQNAVATMASGRPSDTQPDEWYNMARTVDQNRATNEAFSSSSRNMAPIPSRPVGTSTIRLAPPTQRHAHTVPTPGNPVPMDVDLLRKKTSLPSSCFRCGKTGHFGRDCPDRFDVRTLSLDELQEILENRLAQLDVAPPELNDPIGPIEEKSDQEDF